MKTIKYFFEFITVITLFFIFKIIGLKNASNLGGMMGKFFGPLFRSKSITKKNIKIGFIGAGKYKAFFRNIYIAGALLVTYYDLATKS